MGLRDRGFALLARQLGGPRGLTGRLVASRLNRFNRSSIEAAVDVLGPSEGATVADVGFGGGLGLELLARRVGPTGVVHGVDPMVDMVRRAERRWPDLVRDDRVELHAATVEALPLDDDSIDGVISCNTIYFVADLDAGARELARVVRPGGAVVIGMADPAYFEGRPFADHGFHIRDVDTVGRTLERSGFDPPRLHPVDIERTTFHLLRAEVAS